MAVKNKKLNVKMHRRTKAGVRISASARRPPEQEPPIIIGGGGSVILWVRKTVTMTPMPATSRYYRWQLDVDIDEVDVFEGGAGNEYSHGVDHRTHATTFWE